MNDLLTHFHTSLWPISSQPAAGKQPATRFDLHADSVRRAQVYPNTCWCAGARGDGKAAWCGREHLLGFLRRLVLLCSFRARRSDAALVSCRRHIYSRHAEYRNAPSTHLRSPSLPRWLRLVFLINLIICPVIFQGEGRLGGEKPQHC